MTTRLYVDTPLAVGQTLALPEDAARHWVQVLRARVGDTAWLFNGHGGEYVATLTNAGKRNAEVHIDRQVEVNRESSLRLVLAQAVSKGDRMDYTLQKAVELGVDAIQPLISERSVIKLDAERWDKKIEHWRGVIISACEQSGRTRIPQLQPVLKLSAWLSLPAASGLRLTLAPTAEQSLRDLPRAGEVSLLAGPEGGFSDGEIQLTGTHGWTAVRFGPRVLRTETAGVAAMAAIQTLWGDLG